MKFLANENFPLSSAKFLKDAGFDIVHIGVEYAGITDTDVMNKAISEERTIVTFDRDYGELVFKYGFMPAKGVIYFRLKNYTPESPGVMIKEICDQKLVEFDRALSVIDETGIRQRKY